MTNLLHWKYHWQSPIIRVFPSSAKKKNPHSHSTLDSTQSVLWFKEKMNKRMESSADSCWTVTLAWMQRQRTQWELLRVCTVCSRFYSSKVVVVVEISRAFRWKYVFNVCTHLTLNERVSYNGFFSTIISMTSIKSATCSYNSTFFMIQLNSFE